MTETTARTRALDSARVEALIGAEEARFRQARPRSASMLERARRVMPRGVPSSFQDSPPQPVYVDRGQGSRVWDVDGNEYVDLHNGFGVMVVGHAHPKVTEAIARQAARGTHFAQPVEDDIVVAEDLGRRFGLPLWRFTNSGTESTLDAVRLARGVTGRDLIVKIEASYHGHHDALMVSVEPPPERMGPADQPASVPSSGGIPLAVAELTRVVPFNDLPALERMFQAHPQAIAGVIVEPAMMNIGFVLPDPGYLQGVVDLAHRHGAIAIFDEVKTGLTLAPGGATERFGVTPDVVCLAKALGGGVPCGAIGGTEAVMAAITDGRVAQMGTFNGNPLTMAAARATLLDVLTPDAYEHLDTLAQTMRDGCNQVIAEHELPFHVIAIMARGSVTYRAEPVRNYRDYLEVDERIAYLAWLYQCNRGVLMAPGAEENWTLSVQHSTADVQRYVDNLRQLAQDLRR